MERIGIGELRGDLRHYLERASQGEAFDVTDRGRPLARLGPLPQAGGRLARLVVAGRVTPARRRLGDLPPARTAAAGRIASQALLRERRADER